MNLPFRERSSQPGARSSELKERIMGSRFPVPGSAFTNHEARITKHGFFHDPLCVVEAINNAILHAYRNRGGSPVEVEMQVVAGRLRLRVSDHGTPLKRELLAKPTRPDPAHPAESGRGLELMRHLMDDVRYASRGGKNTLTLSKQLTHQGRETPNMKKTASRKRRIAGVQTGSPQEQPLGFQESIRYHVRHSCGKPWAEATQRDLFTATSLAVREVVSHLTQIRRTSDPAVH